VTATSGAISTGTWMSLDVTPLVTGNGSFGFALTTTGQAVRFASKEAGAGTSPQLVVETSMTTGSTSSPSTTAPTTTTTAPTTTTAVETTTTTAVEPTTTTTTAAVEPTTTASTTVAAPVVAPAAAAAFAPVTSSKLLAAPGYNFTWRSINPPWVPRLPPGSGFGRRMVYSVGQQRVWAVEASGRIVKTHRVSGKLGQPAPGWYQVYSRSRHTYAAFNPSIRWEYMVRFARGRSGLAIGFHQIPVQYGRPVQSVAQLGQPLSGGCVRQAPADAIWVWNWAPIGTTVVVTP
jgi:lipoprotein-anchoring transpeptidase ErfK/SrfK